MYTSQVLRGLANDMDENTPDWSVLAVNIAFAGWPVCVVGKGAFYTTTSRGGFRSGLNKKLGMGYKYPDSLKCIFFISFSRSCVLISFLFHCYSLATSQSNKKSRKQKSMHQLFTYERFSPFGHLGQSGQLGQHKR